MDKEVWKHVEGIWNSRSSYPKNWFDLEKEVRGFLMQKLSVRVPKKVHGIVVPHAGYLYSGNIAGKGYGLLRFFLRNNKIKVDKAIVIGPSHTLNLHGAITFDEKAFLTPLGSLPISYGGFQKQVIEEEHSIENQIPFLQALDFKKITPVLVGEIDWKEAKEIARKIARMKGIYIFSTDLSHALAYQKAVKQDKKSLRVLEQMKKDRFLEIHACGLYALMVLIELCKLKRTSPHTIDYENSGDVTKERRGVVGYGSMWF